MLAPALLYSDSFDYAAGPLRTASTTMPIKGLWVQTGDALDQTPVCDGNSYVSIPSGTVGARSSGPAVAGFDPTKPWFQKVTWKVVSTPQTDDNADVIVGQTTIPGGGPDNWLGVNLSFMDGTSGVNQVTISLQDSGGGGNGPLGPLGFTFGVDHVVWVVYNGVDALVFIDGATGSSDSYDVAGGFAATLPQWLQIDGATSSSNVVKIGAVELWQGYYPLPSISGAISGNNLVVTFSPVNQAESYRYSIDNGATWTATGSGGTATTFTLTGYAKTQVSVVVQGIYNSTSIAAQGILRWRFPPAKSSKPWLNFHPVMGRFQ